MLQSRVISSPPHHQISLWEPLHQGFEQTLPETISLNAVSSDTKLGRNVARTFLDYYKLNNHIKDNRPIHIHR